MTVEQFLGSNGPVEMRFSEQDLKVLRKLAKGEKLNKEEEVIAHRFNATAKFWIRMIRERERFMRMQNRLEGK